MRIPSLCIAATCWLGFALACQAEPIPQRYLDADHATCLAGCAKKGAPENFCKAACDCSMEKISESVTLDEYLSVVQAMAQNTEPPKSVMNRLTQLSLDCAIEAKKAMPSGN
ncbi:hypothetical protein [Dongia sedimenti]|uniref:Uncharacterized protein n=1 Tax=Dongia sedimenti TaxID=3064282 RepID=A0ABU0YSR8_9PROT|nr:hypothetical protein [Rhodospirillaceae bacterium R-7]